MKKTIAIILSAALVLSIAAYLYVDNQVADTGTGIKRCPEAWYDNQMPSVALSDSPSGTRNRQYLIVDGERRETEEFNLQWISRNCEVSRPAAVY